jgi:cobalt-zinc-cadmium efflux system outer membrane protein
MSLAFARCAAVLFLLAPFAAPRAAEPASAEPLGSRLEPLLAAAQSLSPTARAAALSAQAASDRAGGTGTLPDPTIRLQYGEMNCMPGADPIRPASCTQLSVEQEFPLWGKRGLARDVASAHATQAGADSDRIRLELLAAVKQAFAEYYVANESIHITVDIRSTVSLAAELAQRRYEQALGSQQDAIALKVELAELDIARTRKEAGLRRAAARINALLNRPINAPLGSPAELPAAPNADALNLDDLVRRARDANPILKGQDAAIAAAAGTKTLAEKSWYPDFTLGVSMMNQARQSPGYAGMVSVKIPLNTAQRRAETSAARSEMDAARGRREAADAEIRGALETSFWSLKEAQGIAAILHESHIPQANLSLKSALSGYGQNRVALTTVLDAERHVLQNQNEHLMALMDQQKAIAELERLIGGPL